MFRLFSIIVIVCFFTSYSSMEIGGSSPFIVVLGIAQDAGYPQAGCEKDCCRKYYSGELSKKLVSSIALVDPETNQKWLFDATPDISQQLYDLDNIQKGKLSGIFLTHAHIGHYTGLMYLGREAMNTDQLPVYAMPRMHDYLKTNGPWSQLVTLNNIELRKIENDSAVHLTKNISVTPIRVPHRDEYSETVGYKISTSQKSLLFIPDIDKWGKWDKDIKSMVGDFDHLLLDGTFYDGDELPGRNMAEIPHPFVTETMKLFADLPASEKTRIFFIHFNHTNPLLNAASAAAKEVRNRGFQVATEKMKIIL